MTTVGPRPPRIADLVHYWPLVSGSPGCRAAVVTEIHRDAHLASLAVLHPTGMEFLPEVRQAELEHMWEQYEPGTWHLSGHQ